MRLPELLKTFPGPLWQLVVFHNFVPESVGFISDLSFAQNSVEGQSLHYGELFALAQVKALPRRDRTNSHEVLVFLDELVCLNTSVKPSFTENVAWIERIKVDINVRLYLNRAALVELSANTAVALNQSFHSVRSAALGLSHVKKQGSLPDHRNVLVEQFAVDFFLLRIAHAVLSIGQQLLSCQFLLFKNLLGSLKRDLLLLLDLPHLLNRLWSKRDFDTLTD